MGRIVDTRIYQSEDFLLHSHTARVLYHEVASSLPVIDYHNHLSPQAIAEDKKFETITELWLSGDHYKWRAMRALGIDEKLISGNASDRDKFKAWASALPSTLRNPLFDWSHLELKRYFGIDVLLHAANADYIFDQCNEMLKSKEFSVKGLLRKMHVEILCTTDAPQDSLQYHKKINASKGVRVYPSFRPDKFIGLGSSEEFRKNLQELEEVAGPIHSFEDFKSALISRIEYFHSVGGRISDHGLESMPVAETASKIELKSYFNILKNEITLSESDKYKFASTMLLFLSREYHKKNWVQQFHLGAFRNTRSAVFNKYGPDQGYDSIHDIPQAAGLQRFLDNLDKTDQLTKTILYNLNPADSAVFATMAANFNQGTAGKMQYGAAWWFLDQKRGIVDQLNTISDFGLLSEFPGMLTDSRSFISFPRHEYFRRIFCNMLGEEIERGDLPEDMELIGSLVRKVCYENASKYFGFEKTR